jgi:hypothetical protein
MEAKMITRPVFTTDKDKVALAAEIVGRLRLREPCLLNGQEIARYTTDVKNTSCTYTFLTEWARRALANGGMLPWGYAITRKV